MAGPLDAVARSLAGTLTDRFGKPVTYTRTSSTFDPVSGTTADTSTAKTVRVQMGDTTRLERLGFAETGTIEHGDLLVEVPAASFEAQFGSGAEPDTQQDTVTIDGDEFAVKQKKPQWANEDVFSWQLQVRR